MSQSIRTPTTLPVDEELLAAARELKIDISEAVEDGIAKAVKAERERLWRIENAEAIAASNAYVEKNGLPLAKYRQF
ncbi:MULTISPECIES: type II toxin-antitoxin system CcdA family antitoxin [unclassified Rhizobium]|uniref:type II toxin-antitoxin system CcdA family antitoxin n=1 Tax=unclassified Rhizobium TaxID=2613769 RepID=UPI001ADBB415|nr:MULTISPECIES: type II toxin-antitoxin system CcdA family antitoxin [unclassified Rhizobium]MBO9122291.1 type II toxin-antitoxin system CcdA family antitoxin [Rhizobium sp. 16-488-2b]MBO9172639.1 type II toxin-antitoxin system CcdA family antitoxin [Rhizobium sp. 16-488-2a]